MSPVVLKKIKSYYQSHIIYSFIAFIFILVMLSITIIHVYLKQEYKKYLKAKTYNVESLLLSSVNDNLDYIMKEFIQIAAKISVDNELYELAQEYNREKSVLLKRELTDRLSIYSQYSQWIENICIASGDGLVFQYDRLNYVNHKTWGKDNNYLLTQMDETIFDLLQKNTIPRYSIHCYNLKHSGDDSLYLFHIAVPLKGDNAFSKVKYSIIISIDMNVFEKFLDTIHKDGKDLAYGYITDSSGVIIFHKDINNIGLKKEKYLGKGSLGNISEDMDKVGWTINISIDENKMQQQMDGIYSKVFIFYLAIIFLSMTFLIFINFLILKPINAIYQSIQQTKKGNLNQKIMIEGKHEIWKLAEEYNEMIAALRNMNYQVEKHHREKLISIKKKQKAEQEALESQINAHFICNTLGAINYEVMEAGNHKASILIKKLSNILRYTFDQKNQNVYMSQEIAWIEQYLYLQKFRFENVFDYEIDFPEAYESWPCRKLMLQPFVENSILHGFEGRQSGGQITIRGEGEGSFLKLIIADNGKGMDTKTEKIIRDILNNPLNTNKDNVGIGISNVVTRMRMYYGKDLKIELITKKDKGTTYIFHLPIPVEMRIVSAKDRNDK